jgi:hypothetical protein
VANTSTGPTTSSSSMGGDANTTTRRTCRSAVFFGPDSAAFFTTASLSTPHQNFHDIETRYSRPCLSCLSLTSHCAEQRPEVRSQLRCLDYHRKAWLLPKNKWQKSWGLCHFCHRCSGVCFPLNGVSRFRASMCRTSTSACTRHHSRREQAEAPGRPCGLVHRPAAYSAASTTFVQEIWL